MERNLLWRFDLQQLGIGNRQNGAGLIGSFCLAQRNRHGCYGGPTLWSRMGCRMMETTGAVLAGAIATASAVATLFFLRFWRQTGDSFFLLFAMAFAIDAATRLTLGIWKFSEETEPLIYLGRLIMFSLIIVAIVRKNRPS
jgi:hypothetical protein